MTTNAPRDRPAFYITGGTLPADAPSYVERQADRDLLAALRQGEYCYLLNARQMGKSSLCVRAIARLREEGVRTVFLDLTKFGGRNLTAEQWYAALLAEIGRELGRRAECLAYWKEHLELPAVQRLFGALTEVALGAGVSCQVLGVGDGGGGDPSAPNTQDLTSNTSGRLVLFIDEIDVTRSLPFSTDEFFAAIRQCYVGRATEPALQGLTVCLLGTATPAELIEDTRISPFNIGRRIEVRDFTPAEAAPLAAGLAGSRASASGPAPASGPARARAPARARNTLDDEHEHEQERSASADALLARILYWTGGHPYLTQRLCRAVAEAHGQHPNPKSKIQNPKSIVDRLCKALFLTHTAKEGDDNLSLVRNRLLKSEADLASLLELYGKLRAGKGVADGETNPLCGVLKLSGVAKVEAGRLVVRNRIYGAVFDRGWVAQHMPDAELRRQREAYRRGLWRAAGVSAAALVVMGSLVVTAVQEERRANRSARAEAEQRRTAQEGQQALRRSQYADRLNLAQQAVDEGNLARAQELLDAVRPEPGQEDLRGFEWRYLWRRCQGEALATLDDHRGGVITVAFSSDGKLLASIGWGHALRLWDVARRQEIAVFKYPDDWVTSVAFSPDGKTLAASVNGVTLWDVASQRQIGVLKHKVGSGELAFSPDGRLFASASGYDGTVRLWATGPRPPWRTIATIQGYPKTLEFRPCLVFSPDSRLLVTDTRDGPIRLWDVGGYARASQTWPKTGPRLVATLGENLLPIICAAFSPDGKTLATGGKDNNISLWDLATRRAVATLWGHTEHVQSVAFSPDGKVLASCSQDNTVKLWDPATRQELTTFKGHKAAVLDVAFSPDGKLLASGGGWGDGTVKLWNPAMRAGSADVIRQQAAFYGMAFSPDGRTLATGSADGTVKLWDVATRSALAALRGHKRLVYSLAFSPDGKLLASGSDDQTLKLWNLASGRPILTQPGFVGGNMALAFSPDGRTLAWQGQTAVRLWSLAARRVVSSFPGGTADGGCLGFSPDGKTLAVGSGPGGTTLWDLATHRAAGWLSASGNFFFSPDGKILAGPTDPDQVKLWDLTSRRLLDRLRLHAEIAGAAAFTPDGRTMAVPSGTGVALINMTARQEAAILKGHAAAVNWLAFSPDGDTLASGAGDGTVRLWRAATFQETDRLRIASTAGDRSVTLQWQPLSSAVGYHLYRGPAGAGRTQLAPLATLPAAAASFTDRSPILVDGRPQAYAAAAVFPTAGGKTIEGPRVSLQAIPVAIPPGWLGCSLDEGAHSGSVLFEGPAGPILIRGSGVDSPDHVYYLCQPLRGNFQITVRALTRPTATFVWAKAGLMIRDSLAAGARNGFLLTTPTPNVITDGLVFQWNAATNGGEGGGTTILQAKELKLPILLRLTRQGDTVTPTYSRDGGQHFRPAGTPLAFEEPLPPTVYAGLAITSHNVDLVSEARFDDLRVEALPR